MSLLGVLLLMRPAILLFHHLLTKLKKYFGHRKVFRYVFDQVGQKLGGSTVHPILFINLIVPMLYELHWIYHTAHQSAGHRAVINETAGNISSVYWYLIKAHVFIHTSKSTVNMVHLCLSFLSLDIKSGA